MPPRAPLAIPIPPQPPHETFCVPAPAAYPSCLAPLCMIWCYPYQDITDEKLVTSHHKWTPEADVTAEVEAGRRPEAKGGCT